MSQLTVRNLNTVPLSIFSHSVSGGRNTNSASGSTKFLINHGQATRSTLIFSRVIHFTPEHYAGCRASQPCFFVVLAPCSEFAFSWATWKSPTFPLPQQSAATSSWNCALDARQKSGHACLAHRLEVYVLICQARRGCFGSGAY